MHTVLSLVVPSLADRNLSHSASGAPAAHGDGFKGGISWPTVYDDITVQHRPQEPMRLSYKLDGIFCTLIHLRL